MNRENHRRMNAQKRRVWKTWLKIMLEKNGKRLGEIQNKNKIAILARLQLKTADHQIFSKLRNIQQLLQITFVPWRLWATRVG
jgi:hypothetical protein